MFVVFVYRAQVRAPLYVLGANNIIMFKIQLQLVKMIVALVPLSASGTVVS